MSEQTDRQVVGHQTCPFCPARVAVTKGKKGKLYMMCDGRADQLACGSRIYLGWEPSRARLKAAAEAERKPTPENEHEPGQPSGLPAGVELESQEPDADPEPAGVDAGAGGKDDAPGFDIV